MFFLSLNTVFEPFKLVAASPCPPFLASFTQITIFNSTSTLLSSRLHFSLYILCFIFFSKFSCFQYVFLCSPLLSLQCCLNLLPFIICHLYLFPATSLSLLSTSVYPPTSSWFNHSAFALSFSTLHPFSFFLPLFPSLCPFLSRLSTSCLPLSCPDSLCCCSTVIITALAIKRGLQGFGGGVVKEIWEAVAVETKRLCKWGMRR